MRAVDADVVCWAVPNVDAAIQQAPRTVAGDVRARCWLLTHATCVSTRPGRAAKQAAAWAPAMVHQPSLVQTRWGLNSLPMRDIGSDYSHHTECWSQRRTVHNQTAVLLLQENNVRSGVRNKADTCAQVQPVGTGSNILHVYREQVGAKPVTGVTSQAQLTPVTAQVQAARPGPAAGVPRFPRRETSASQ